jgi:predicted GNAT family N-acyltransferase
MGPLNDVTIECVDWRDAHRELSAVRTAVFVVEQQVPEELEWDGIDEKCDHVLARAPDGIAIGSGRLLPDGHIGRMAVLASWRGHGVGGALLQALITLAQERGFHKLELHAQTHALGFYERYGFRAEGAEFIEAGIPHFRMVRVVDCYGNKKQYPQRRRDAEETQRIAITAKA